jgi:hypothetical protein
MKLCWNDTNREEPKNLEKNFHSDILSPINPMNTEIETGPQSWRCSE